MDMKHFTGRIAVAEAERLDRAAKKLCLNRQKIFRAAMTQMLNTIEYEPNVESMAMTILRLDQEVED